MTLADYCRWANVGYDDGLPGTEADIQERIEKLETNCRSYAKSLGNMHRLVDKLESQSQ